MRAHSYRFLLMQIPSERMSFICSATRRETRIMACLYISQETLLVQVKFILYCLFNSTDSSPILGLPSRNHDKCVKNVTRSFPFNCHIPNSFRLCGQVYKSLFSVGCQVSSHAGLGTLSPSNLLTNGNLNMFVTLVFLVHYYLF